MVDLLERLEVLLDLECDSYRTVDYLAAKHLECMDPTSFALDLCDLESAFASSSSSSETGVNEVWREKICEWSYQVIDHFDFSREVVSVAIHYLDRFLAKVQVNKKLFQLVAMTSLYMAIKIYEPGTLCMSSMIELSRGCFSPAQMAEMEMALLRYVEQQQIVELFLFRGSRFSSYFSVPAVLSVRLPVDAKHTYGRGANKATACSFLPSCGHANAVMFRAFFPV